MVIWYVLLLYQQTQGHATNKNLKLLNWDHYKVDPWILSSIRAAVIRSMLPDVSKLASNTKYNELQTRETGFVFGVITV